MAQWPLLAQMEKSLIKCRKNKRCGYNQWFSNLNNEQKLQCEKNPIISHFLKSLAVSSFAAQREGLEKLEKNLTTNLGFRQIQKSQNVEHLKKGKLEIYRVRLSSGTLDQAGQAFLKNQLEKFSYQLFLR